MRPMPTTLVPCRYIRPRPSSAPVRWASGWFCLARGFYSGGSPLTRMLHMGGGAAGKEGLLGAPREVPCRYIRPVRPQPCGLGRVLPCLRLRLRGFPSDLIRRVAPPQAALSTLPHRAAHTGEVRGAGGRGAHNRQRARVVQGYTRPASLARGLSRHDSQVLVVRASDGRRGCRDTRARRR